MSESQISFYQLKCDTRKITESYQRGHNHEDTTMFLQEPYLSHGRPFGLRRQHFHHVHDGRTAIYTPNLVASSFIKIPSLVRHDLVAGVLEWNNRKVVVASLYMHESHANPIKPDLEDLINHCKRYNLGLICGADVNAWSDQWFSQRLKHRNC